jgi:HD superfamily phosphohydrolase
MAIEIVRRIRENLYGSIDISPIEDLVLAHPDFQRLRRIKQTAFLSLVFPGATHTRFEHSLGVLHLASKAWNKLGENQKRLELSCSRYQGFKEREIQNTKRLSHGAIHPAFGWTERIFSNDYIHQVLRLAAMLHDVGHPPFSHSGEMFLPTFPMILSENPGLPPVLIAYLKKRHSDGKKVSHEIFTMLLIYKILTEIDAEVDPIDVISIIVPDIEPTSISPLRERNLYLLCHQLVSGEIDVDRMDYLRRDAQEAGVIYGIFDIDRVLDSLSLYYDSEKDYFGLAIRYSGLAAFEDFMRARQSMYLQVYLHKTTMSGDIMLKWIRNRIPSFFLPASIHQYVKIDDISMMGALDTAIKSDAHMTNVEKKKTKSVAEDILLHRRLWKRVYEKFQYQFSVDAGADRMREALKQNGISYETVKICLPLTKFTPRREEEKSRNVLRLIKKDDYMFPCVEPIEDHSRIISDDSKMYIERIYVDMEAVSMEFQEKFRSGRVFD